MEEKKQLFKKKLITLEQHQEKRKVIPDIYPKPNRIECPNCKSELCDRSREILTSNPAQKRIICLNCDFKSTIRI